MNRRTGFLRGAMIAAGLAWWVLPRATAMPAGAAAAPERPSFTLAVPLPRPKVQFIGAAAVDGIRLRWSVAGGWLAPAGFRVLRKAPGEGDFAPLAVVKARGDGQIQIRRRAQGGSIQRVPLAVQQFLEKCALPAELGGVEPEALRSVPQFRLTPPTILSAREGNPAEFANRFPEPPTAEWIEQERQRLANLTPLESAVLRVQGARRLTLTLANTNWAAAGDLGLAWTDAKVQNGMRYEYRIEMLGADGQPIANYDVAPQAILAVTAGVDTAPQPPSKLAAEPGDRRVAFHWKRPSTGAPQLGQAAPADQDDRNISYYNIYRSDSASGAEGQVNDLPVVIAYTPTRELPGIPARMAEPRVLFLDGPAMRAPGEQPPADAAPELENGREYFYSIEAVDVFGRVSPRTPRVSARPFARPLPPVLTTRPSKLLPGPPTRRVAISGDVRPGGDGAQGPVVRQANYQDDVRIAWRLPAGKEPGAQPAGVQVAGFRVYRQEAAPDAELVEVGRVGPAAGEYTDKAPPRDKAYRYCVTTLDGWDHESLPSEVIEVTLPDRTPLPTPSIAGVSTPGRAGAGGGLVPTAARITIRWTCAAAANIAGFNIYRAEARWPDEQPGAFELCSPPIEAQSRSSQRPPVQIAAAAPVPIPAPSEVQMPFGAADALALQARVPPELLSAGLREFSESVPAGRSTTYYYEIEAVSPFGFRSPRSPRGSVRVVGVEGPSAPRAIAAVSESEGGGEGVIGDITVRWARSPDHERVVSYNVYWTKAQVVGADTAWAKLSQQPIQLADVPATDLRALLKLPPRPGAGGVGGAAGAPAATEGAQATTPDAVGEPAATEGAQATPAALAAALRALPRLMRAHRHANPALQPGQPYWYAVEAVDVDGVASPKSNAVAVSPAKIRARVPQQLAVAAGSAAGGSAVRVTWVNFELNLKGYLLERGLQREGPFRQICGLVKRDNAQAGTAFDCADTSALPGVDYYYRLTALDTVGNRSESVVAGPVRLPRQNAAAD